MGMSARNYPLAEKPKVRIPADPATHLAISLKEFGWPYMTLADQAELRRLLDGFLVGQQEVV